ncbi:uncharacterized protein LOC123334523 [Bubalus bubalis]|uniref:uncharacterized protein LOC123334523 n=1 Tax=Bubalus bubalis TaxID=89462 RepID=UPI001E1B61DA|nr:uncharacterized protein LOC123334523 [Bubalus bubalis]
MERTAPQLARGAQRPGAAAVSQRGELRRVGGGFAAAAAASASPHRLFGCPSGNQRTFFLPRASGPYSPLHEHVRGHFRSALWACESAHPHAAPGAPAPADRAGPTPRLGVPLPQREIGRREPERRGPSGLRGRTLAAHTPAERPRNAPGLQISAEQRVASNPTRTLVDLGAAPYNRSRVTHVHGKQPSARKKAGRGQSCQPPGPKALLVACFFPPVPKSEDPVVIRRHLSRVGWGVQPRSKHWTCELQLTRCGLREAARGLLTENASQGSGSELEEAK